MLLSFFLKQKYTPYLSEDKFLIWRYMLPPFFTRLESQVCADVVTHNASGRFPCVIADLTVSGVFKELREDESSKSFHAKLCHAK